MTSVPWYQVIRREIYGHYCTLRVWLCEHTSRHHRRHLWLRCPDCKSPNESLERGLADVAAGRVSELDYPLDDDDDVEE